ncbi:MAG: hypothetical protein KDA84_02105 [Planctomycetaceae bacterium]|nr:hypothetical protein [Planctomycetaceae bacterium]
MRDTQEQHDQNLTNIGQSMEETAASVSTLKTEEPRERGRLKKRILGMFHALEQAQSESREELDGQIGELQNVIAMRFDALNEEITNHDRVHSEAGRLIQRLSQENHALEQKVERLESRNQSLQEKTTHCESLLAKTQGQLGELEKSVLEISQIQQESQTRVPTSLKIRLTEFFQKMMPTVNKSPLPVHRGEKAKPANEHSLHGTPIGT